MTAQAAVFRYELRRHVWPLIVATAGLLCAPFLLSRHGSWRYWELPGAELLGTLIPFLLAPLVGSWIGAHTWAEDRSQRVLEWLVTRPLLPSRFFKIRLLAVLTAAGTWFLVAWLLMLPVLRLSRGSLDGMQYSILLLLAWSLGFGLFLSALVERPGLAFLLSWIGTYVFHVVVIVFLVRMWFFSAVNQVADWHGRNATVWHWITVSLELLLPTAILLAATWAAVRICPGDPKRIGRGLKALLAGSAGYVVFLVAVWILV